MLRWLQSGHAREATRGVAATSAHEQTCPGMARALKRILSKREQPEVLDLGQFSRSAAVYLAQRGARVYVENFEAPPPSPKRRKANGDKRVSEPKKPLVIPQPDRKFDLVLAWEHGDFVPPDRLKDFAAEIARVLVPGGWLLLYAKDNPGAGGNHTDPPACYRLLGDDRFVRSSTTAPARRRWTHPNRAIERALAPLAVQSIHLQRNRIREFLVRKPDADA
jgi:SAM-dependent methyltransferase